MKTKINRTLFLLIAVLIIVSTPQRGQAYDNDTHFWLTYYLAIKTGYSPVQAAQIASANISTDLDPHTQPVFPSPNFRRDILRPKVYVQNVRIYLHALPLRISCMGQIPAESEINNPIFDPRISKDPAILDCLEKQVREKQDYRWSRVLMYRDNPGVFLHYLQDTYSHKGFWSAVGHAGYEYVDYLSSSPATAKLMTIDTVNHLIEFKKLMAGNPVGTADSIAQNWRELKAETWEEIDLTLAQLYEANPSHGIEETALLKQWVASEGKFKLSILKRLYERWKYNRFPDSFKARAVIKKQLKLEENQLPLIWFYDLQQGGFPIKKVEIYETSKIRSYRNPNINENFEKKTARNLEKKRLCLPWKVVGPEVVEVPLCK